jgi:hypothetical protein
VGAQAGCASGVRRHTEGGITMRKYDRLKKEALEGCEWRGHHMNHFSSATIEYAHRKIGNSICKDCGMAVSIDTDPPANGIDIGGEAVALNCK